MIWIFLIIALAVLIIGSCSDLRTREVPDWINFALIFIGVGIHSILAITTSSWQPLLSSGVGLGIGIGVAFAMYYMGQWGGGDAKMMMGLGAIIGFDLSNLFLIGFIINAFILGAAYGLIYGVVLALRKRKEFAKKFRELYYKTPKYLRIAVLWLLLLMIVLGLVVMFLFPSILLISVIGLLIVLLAVYYLYLFAKAVEKCCMLKYVKPSELTEGDWIVDEIKIKGKYVCGPKDLGIEKKQIQQLKKHNIKKVLIKDGIPFVPSFLISFIFTYYFGNVFYVFFTIL